MMWCIPPEQSAEFVCAMETVLDVYQRPYDSSLVSRTDLTIAVRAAVRSAGVRQSQYSRSSRSDWANVVRLTTFSISINLL